MTAFLLDTNAISETIKSAPDPHLKAWIDSVSPWDLYLSSTVLAELSVGVEIMPFGRRRTVLETWYDTIVRLSFRDRILPFDVEAAGLFGQLSAKARRSGRPAHMADAQIAAVAAVHGLTVATRDTADFAGFGVALVNPFQPA